MTHLKEVSVNEFVHSTHAGSDGSFNDIKNFKRQVDIGNAANQLLHD